MGTFHDDSSPERETYDAAVDASAVTQVVLAERQGRDRGWWDQMRAQYWPDSHVRLSWYDGNGTGFVAGSEAMARRGDVAWHHASAPVVHVRGDRAHVEAPVTLCFRTEVDGVTGDLASYTRLNYRLERREGRWLILALEAIYEYTTLTPSVPGEQIVIPADDLAQYRSSYAILAWNVARSGVSPSNEQLGDDRPEEVATFYADVHEWLAQG